MSKVTTSILRNRRIYIASALVVTAIGVFSLVNGFGQATSAETDDAGSIQVNETLTCAPTPSGLVSWWSGDGTARDIVDGNHGVLRGGTGYTPAMVDHGFEFDGVDDFVWVPDSENLRITGDVTVDLWAKRNMLGDRSTMVIKGGGKLFGSDLPTAYALHIRSDDRLVGWFTLADNSNVELIGPLVKDFEFHHYAYVREGSEHSLFMDGVVVAFEHFSGTPGDSGLPLVIGAMRNNLVGGYKYNFPGILDEVEVFNRALGDEEIQSIFEAGSAGKCKPSLSPSGKVFDVTAIRLDTGEEFRNCYRFEKDGSFNLEPFGVGMWRGP